MPGFNLMRWLEQRWATFQLRRLRGNVELSPELVRELGYFSQNGQDVYMDQVVFKGAEVPFLQIDGYSEMLSGIVSRYDPNHTARIGRELKKHGGSAQQIQVQAVPLSRLLEDRHVDQIDFLSIDTEGSELEVLSSIDWERVSVKAVAVENNYARTEIRSLLAEHGFTCRGKIGADEIFVARASSESR